MDNQKENNLDNIANKNLNCEQQNSENNQQQNDPKTNTENQIDNLDHSKANQINENVQSNENQNANQENQIPGKQSSIQDMNDPNLIQQQIEIENQIKSNTNNNPLNINNNNNNPNINQNANNKPINSEYYNENNQPKYEDIINYENQLRAEMEKTPLISPVTSIDSLIKEYKNSIFEKSIHEITKKYKYIRYARRDGNCFYRSYLYRLFEHCFLNNDFKSHKEILQKTEHCRDLLERNGFEWLVVEEFYNVFINEFKLVMTLEQNDRRKYLDILFSDKEKGNYMIAFVRIYISAYIKENRLLYENFIFDEDLDSWCRREVEPIDVECDNLQIIAVTNCFNTGVLIENLTDKKIDTMKLPEEGCERYFIHLFFRPGHYDILYNN